MGPWSWYLVAGDFIALLMFLLLYLLFSLSGRRAQRQVATQR